MIKPLIRKHQHAAVFFVFLDSRTINPAINHACRPQVVWIEAEKVSKEKAVADKEEQKVAATGWSAANSKTVKRT